MAVPIEIIITAGVYLIMFIGIIFDELIIFKRLGGFGVMIMGIFALYPGIPGIDRGNLVSLAIGTISIGLGFFFLIENSFSFDRQVDSFDQDDDGRFHD